MWCSRVWPAVSIMLSELQVVLHPGFVSAASPWRVSCRYPRHSSNLKKEEDVFTQALTFMSHTSSCYWGACVGSCSLEIPCLHPSCSTGGEEREVVVVAVHGSARRCKCYLFLLCFIIIIFLQCRKCSCVKCRRLPGAINISHMQLWSTVINMYIIISYVYTFSN